MNTIESRIYSDAVSAAAEITPADIPALCLEPAPGRSRRRRRIAAGGTTLVGMARPAGRRRWLAPLGAVVGVAAVVAAVLTVGPAAVTGHRGAGPASGTGGGAGALPAASPPGRPGASPAQETLAAEALDNYFPATGAQYTAGFAFQWTLLKVEDPAYNACMQRAGFPVPPFSVPEQTFIEGFPDNSVFPDLAQRAQTGSMGGPDSFNEALPRPQSPAGAGAGQSCQAAAGAPFARIDAIASLLQSQWMNIVTAVQHSAPVSATQQSFSACLESRGVPASFAEQTDPGASNPLFYGFFGWADTLSQQATSNSQQAADDRRAAQVFVACAGPTVALVERLQAAQRTTFFTQHAAQISQIKALAEAVLAPGH